MQKIGLRALASFQVVYSCVSRCPLDLTTPPNRTGMHDKAIDFIEDLQHIHKLTHDHLVASAAKYKLIAYRHHLPSSPCPVHEYNKLKDRKIGPLEVLQKINPNAYRLRLPDRWPSYL